MSPIYLTIELSYHKDRHLITVVGIVCVLYVGFEQCAKAISVKNRLDSDQLASCTPFTKEGM